MKQATHLNPRYVDAYNSLGISLEGLNRHNEAFDAYSKAATILTEDAYSQVEKDGGGWLLVERSAEGHQVGVFNAERLSRVHEWLRSTNLFSIVRNNMGRCLAMLGYSNEARKMFEEAIEFTPDGVEFYAPYEGLEKLGEGDLG